MEVWQIVAIVMIAPVVLALYVAVYSDAAKDLKRRGRSPWLVLLGYRLGGVVDLIDRMTSKDPHDMRPDD